MISFEPCKYNCKNAVDYANKVYKLISEQDPEYAKEYISLLMSVVHVSYDGTRLAFRKIKKEFLIPFISSKKGFLPDKRPVNMEKLNRGLILDFTQTQIQDVP